MSPRAPRDLLEELRTYLEHFDQSGHLGDSADVAEVEAQLDRSTEIQTRAEIARNQSSHDPSNRG